MAKTKALISFAVTAKLICAFIFAYADCWFFHEAAHIFMLQEIFYQMQIGAIIVIVYAKWFYKPVFLDETFDMP